MVGFCKFFSATASVAFLSVDGLTVSVHKAHLKSKAKKHGNKNQLDFSQEEESAAVSKVDKFNQNLNVALLNDPKQKLATRVKFLKNLKGKIVAMSDNPVLSSEHKKMKTVISKIDNILSLAHIKQTQVSGDANGGEESDSPSLNAKLDTAVTEVQKEIAELKQNLVKRAFAINKELHDSLAAGKNSWKKTVSASYQSHEDLFKELLEHQDKTFQVQLDIIKNSKLYKNGDVFVIKFVKDMESKQADMIKPKSSAVKLHSGQNSYDTEGNKKLSALAEAGYYTQKESSSTENKTAPNLAVEFGKALDKGSVSASLAESDRAHLDSESEADTGADTEATSQSESDLQKGLDEVIADKASEKQDLAALESSAHLSETQAKSLLPILKKVEKQKEIKEKTLSEMDKKLQRLEETERYYRKHKAVLKKESEVLQDAASAIQKGEVDKLSGAMDRLKELGK